jgi:DNA-binding transcriptional LysR family regulator
LSISGRVTSPRFSHALNVHVDGPFVLNDRHLLIDAAYHGAGLAIVMEDMAASFIADGRLVRVLEHRSPPFSGYHRYYPNRRHPTPAFAALLEELRASAGRGSISTECT